MKTLIALIKNPEESKGFIRYSIQLAEKLESNLHLLHTADLEGYPLGTSNISGQAYMEMKSSLENRAKRVKDLLYKYSEEIAQELTTKVHVDVSAEIGKESLILNGMIDDFLEGSMVVLEGHAEEDVWYKHDQTKNIVLSVSCPVWVIPAASTFNSFHRIVYASDYSKEDMAVLNRVIRILKPFSPQLTALHVTDDMDFDLKVKQAGFQKMLQEKTQYDRIMVETLVENVGEDMSSAISNYCQKFGTDLIVLLQENTGFLKKIFTESPTVKILKQVELPVLVYHPK